MSVEDEHVALDEEWLARLARDPDPPRPEPEPFRTPLLAQRALQREEIEWPPGSGRVALYAPDERALMRAILSGDSPTKANEAKVLHELKAEFGGTLREPHEDGW